MKAVIQRVTEASVLINSRERRSIGHGLMILLGVGKDDENADAQWLAGKIASIRVFEDSDGKTNLAASDIGGEMLVVSQFTLMADTRKGNRPSLDSAARPDQAIPLYNMFTSALKAEFGGNVLTGEFGAQMQVSIINDGPFTILLDSKEKA